MPKNRNDSDAGGSRAETTNLGDEIQAEAQCQFTPPQAERYPDFLDKSGDPGDNNSTRRGAAQTRISGRHKSPKIDCLLFQHPARARQIGSGAPEKALVSGQEQEAASFEIAVQFEITSSHQQIPIFY